jgi:P-type Ca2+ transporter type 2C
MMMTVNALPDPTLENLALPAGSKHLSRVKGAPNYNMDVCTSYLSADGKVEPTTEAIKQSTIAKVDNLYQQALRVLAIAYRPFNPLPHDENDEDMSPDDKFLATCKDLILGGLVASIDPERDGVSDAVIDANKASIRVVAITGDYLKTAIRVVMITMPTRANTVTICEIYKWYLGETIKKFYADLDEERAAEAEAQFGKK